MVTIKTDSQIALVQESVNMLDFPQIIRLNVLQNRFLSYAGCYHIQKTDSFSFFKGSILHGVKKLFLSLHRCFLRYYILIGCGECSFQNRP